MKLRIEFFNYLGNEPATFLLLKYCVKNLTELKEPWPMHLAAEAGLSLFIMFYSVYAREINCNN